MQLILVGRSQNQAREGGMRLAKLARAVELVTAICLVTSCSQAIRPPAASSADIERMLADLDRAAEAGDLAGMLRFFADDAILMLPDQAPIVGKAAIRAMYEVTLQRFSFRTRHEPVETVIFGDIIVHRGNARGSMIPKDGSSALPFDNKYLHVYKRQPDGSWKYWRGAFNANAGPGTEPVSDDWAFDRGTYNGTMIPKPVVRP